VKEVGIIDTTNEDHKFTMELQPPAEGKLYDVTMAHQDLSTSADMNLGAFQAEIQGDFSPPA
jgi:hypothetical protein